MNIKLPKSQTNDSLYLIMTNILGILNLCNTSHYFGYLMSCANFLCKDDFRINFKFICSFTSLFYFVRSQISVFGHQIWFRDQLGRQRKSTFTIDIVTQQPSNVTFLFVMTICLLLLRLALFNRLRVGSQFGCNIF